MKYIPLTMKQVHEGEAKALFTVISTFAGAGGSSTGYRLAGGKILAVNEFIQAARDTYKANYPNCLVMPEDIRLLTGEKIMKRAGIEKGQLDILDGSPPCASFSVIGKREKYWGKEKKYSDTTQRVDDLFLEYARILKDIQPRVFVAENVKGLTMGSALDMLGTKQQDMFGAHEDTFLYKLEQCGYKVQYQILNAKDFGVPQSRERLFLIGVRNDLNLQPAFPDVETSRHIFTVREAITGIYNTDEEIEIATFKEGTEMRRYVLMMKQGEEASKYHPKGSYFNLHRLTWDKPSTTVIQSGGLRNVHPEEHRQLTIKECKRICSFPEDFKVTGSYNQQWERLGRAVPPLLMKNIAEAIDKHILKKKMKSEEIEKENMDAFKYHETHEVMKHIKKCKEGESASVHHEKGNFFNAVRVNGYKPCNTVTQTLGGCAGLFHFKEDRLLSIPEIKRIMSFPDDFIVTGSFAQRWERMGRAVPPLLMKAIADNVYLKILKGDDDDEI